MFHPTVLNLEQLTTEELVSKIEELWVRGAQLLRHPAHTQIVTLINQYTAELDRRRFGNNT
jgi:hypothetical protein